MTIEEMKSKVEEHRDGCKKSAGAMVQFSVTGPAGMAVIDVLVQAIESLEKRVAELEEAGELKR